MSLCVLSRDLSTSFEVYYCGWNSVLGEGVRLVRFDLGVCFGLGGFFFWWMEGW